MASIQQAQSIFNQIQSQVAARHAAVFPAKPAPAPAPAPTQAELSASLQDAYHKNDVDRLRALSLTMVSQGQTQLRAQAATIPTSGGAWGAARVMNTPVK